MTGVFVKRICMFIVKLYQVLISPFLGPACRFEPSCSEYWLEGIKKKGVIQGIFLGIKRILRCHPFHRGGWDPI